ncbi:MAG: hypothetical protein WC824_12980 [Bacteroidota bacterium]|jgi:hypothetical protein
MSYTSEDQKFTEGETNHVAAFVNSAHETMVSLENLIRVAGNRLESPGEWSEEHRNELKNLIVQWNALWFSLKFKAIEATELGENNR